MWTGENDSNTVRVDAYFFQKRRTKFFEGHELPKGVLEACPPRNFLKWMCAEMQSGAFWATILRNVTVCALTSSRRDDFSDVVIYIVIITIFFSGNLGIWGGEGSFYPSNTLHRTLNPKKGKGDCNTLRCPWNPVQIEAAWKCRHNRAVRSTTIGRKQIMETSGPKTLSSVEESIRRRSIVLQPNVPS